MGASLRRLLWGHATRPLACIRHHPTGRQIDRKTAESRQVYGESDPPGDAVLILTGLRERFGPRGRWVVVHVANT